MDDWGLALWRNGNPQSWCVLQKFGDKKRENTYLEKLRSLRTKECRSAFIHWISNVWSDPAIVQPSCIFEDSKKYPCVSWQQCLMQGGSNSDTGTVILLCVFWKIFFFFFFYVCSSHWVSLHSCPLWSRLNWKMFEHSINYTSERTKEHGRQSVYVSSMWESRKSCVGS